MLDLPAKHFLSASPSGMISAGDPLWKLNTGQLRCSSFHLRWDCTLTERWAVGGRT